MDEKEKLLEELNKQMEEMTEKTDELEEAIDTEGEQFFTLLIQQTLLPLSDMPVLNDEVAILLLGKVGVVVGGTQAVFQPSRVLYEIDADMFIDESLEEDEDNS